MAVRPTSGRVRQALFNILRPLLQDAIFVDLFAGTGSVGLEALSHGARHVYFVEHNRRAVSALRANVTHCNLLSQTTIVTAALPQALRKLPHNLQATMVFLDPPYASELAEMTLDALAGTQLLAPHGIIIWQHAAHHPVPVAVGAWSCWQRRRYGNTQLSFYRLPA
jgi:16S rRNA (guanine(966)-N(2))-methyltransferase RsmD